MDLVFPNLQYLEGKTISQLFAVNFLSFLRNEEAITVKEVDLKNMSARIVERINLDQIFSEYIDYTIKNSLEMYHYTTRMLKRGKPTREDYFRKREKEIFIQEIFDLEGATVHNQDEMNLAWHLSKLNEIKKDIRKYRCIQTKEENREVCSACGLAKSGKGDITEAISLSADKWWKPLGYSYKQLEGCDRCADTLSLLSNMVLLWRINILGKKGKNRYVLVPIFRTNTRDPRIIDEINKYLSLLGLFRMRTRGTTSTDHIFNSLSAQPIISKILQQELIDLNVYVQSSSSQGGFVTDNVVSPRKVRRIAEFVVFLNRYFPRIHYRADAKGKGNSRILSNIAYIWSKYGEKTALCELFTQMSLFEGRVVFDVVREILGGARKMKVEYFKNPEKIGEMKEYEWDNPLVRISTFLVAEKANQFSLEGKRSDQAINAPMAILSSIPEKEKNKAIRKFLEEITSKGRSHILSQISDSERFLSQYSTTLRACSTAQLKEIARYMRMFANTYMYKKKEEKEKIFRETILELGYELK
jgi:hypothetical protein